jgi:acetoacetyl-CoA synthetase
MENTVLWRPDAEAVRQSPMMRFAHALGTKLGQDLSSYPQLHAASLAHREEFWSLVWDECGVVGEKGGAVLGHDAMPGAAYFPQARLNFAENLLRRSDDTPALVFEAEDKLSRRLSWRELNDLVSRLQQGLLAAGIRPGDRVAAMMPNMPETIALMLAAASIGAIFSSCSPDFGERGVLDRFGQIEPKLFMACDGYWYAGKRIEIAGKLRGIVEGLPGAAHVIIVDHLGAAESVAAGLPRGQSLNAFLAPFAPQAVSFARLPFNHPLYILFSSGTTGVPKCIVHGAGGTLLQHLKEQKLHCGLHAGDPLFYFTTCGWMMWNWLVSGLACEATLLLFDGSPFHPRPDALFSLAQRHRARLFGVSAKYLDACAKEGLEPAKTHDLSAVDVITSTGSPLGADGFDYVYRSIKADVQLASIAGGTDIVSCFVLGDPTSPVRRGEIQCAGLGMAVEVWDEGGKKRGLGPEGSGKGELVCVKSFPCMPIGFWNDPDGAKYRAAYFERFPGVWHHGDFAEITASGGFIIHGRSDATLNPGGVRIGTAEIYAQVERVPDVLEAIAIGQNWEGDVRVVLFVRLREGVALDDTLVKTLKDAIRNGASPRHVPARIVQVTDIPRTKSGKITELAVRDVVEGREVKNKEALANPEALELFRNRAELQA